jgi:anti-sigma regulatory factor (Ser/Thr protein kinase)
MVQTQVRTERERQMRFYGEVVRLTTNNCLRLVSSAEMPFPDGELLPVRRPVDACRLRRKAAALAAEAGLPADRADDFALAVGEATSNVLKHAGGGTARMWFAGDAVFALITDAGRGITMEMLPKALSPGWSSLPSLGMGFTLMMEMADALWLSTDARGTAICIQKCVRPPQAEPLVCLMMDEVPAGG